MGVVDEKKEEIHTPVNSDQVLSDEDLPPEAGSDDSRQVIRIRDISPDVQIVDISQVGRAWVSRRTVSKGGSNKRMLLSVCVPATATSGRDLVDAPGLSASDPFMAAMWRPQTSPGDPGPVPASSCSACMNCRYCFPEGQLPPE